MDFDSKICETKLLDELDVVLHTKRQDVLTKISSDEQFKNVIKKELNILFYLKKKNKSSETLPNKLLDRFNELSKSNFVVDETINYSDKFQLLDDINYLSIYIKNIFKVDISDLNKLDTSKVEEVKTEDVNPRQTNNTYSNPFGKFAGTSGINNPFLQMSAQVKLKDDIRNGRVYVYDSKPKIIPVIKKIFFFCLLALGTFVFLTGIFGLAIGQFKNGGIVDGKETYTYLSWTSSLYILLGAGFYYYAYVCYKNVFANGKKNLNENFLYRFEFMGVYFIIFFFVFWYIFDCFSIKYTSRVCIFDSLNDLINANQNIKAELYGFFSCEVLSLVTFFVTLIVIVCGNVFNPKVDKVKVNQLIQQYMDDMSRGTSFGC